ncbi:MAG: hypothetical protein U0325_01995 [Polyangiales bacterium]
MTPSHCRLSVLRAQHAPVAVILRRGPSKHTLVVRWDLARHTFDEGQWFAGRIYPERCDLSPDGAWFVYFAAKFKGPIPTYTALSRPPWLTAHALWPETGTWGGGGVFVDRHQLLLNRFGATGDSALSTPLPRGLTVGSLHDAPPSLSPARELRLGWSRAPFAADDPRVAPLAPTYPMKSPVRSVRAHPRRAGLARERIVWGHHHRNAPWLIESYHLVSSRMTRTLDDVAWADWLDDGALAFARGGALFTLADPTLEGPAARTQTRCLVDLAPRTFTRRRAPPEACPPPPRGR